MKKSLLFILILITSMFQAANAEKIPVRIAPTEIISTHNDEVEIGDWINFEIVNDVYSDDKLYLAKGTIVSGFVDFFHPNGWAGDNAEIKIKSFETVDVNCKKIIINYPLIIIGNSKKTNDFKQYISWVFTGFIRGSEIFIEPDTIIFNIFLER